MALRQASSRLLGQAWRAQGAWGGAAGSSSPFLGGSHLFSSIKDEGVLHSSFSCFLLPLPCTARADAQCCTA